MRASRLVSVLLLLQTRGQLTAAQLAEQLEVSVRTIYRDVEALSESGVPIYAERGPHGGVRLVDGYRTRLTGLNEDEAEALFLSGLPGPAAELGLGTVVAAARLKVLAALPPELRARAARINQRFHLDAPGWFQSSDEVPLLERVAEAVWENRRIVIRYARSARDVDRLLDPLGLVLKGGVWYLVARPSGEADQFRTYRVSRIRSITLRDERFERPGDFDLAGFWSKSISAYERGVPRMEVTIRVAPGRVHDLRDIVGEAAARGALPLGNHDPEGWTHLRLRLEWPAEAHEQLMRLGADVEVLAPAELQARMVEAARAVLARHAAS